MGEESVVIFDAEQAVLQSAVAHVEPRGFDQAFFHICMPGVETPNE
jgi:hypothetical protein